MLVDSHQNQNQTNEEDLWDWSTITHLRESDVVMKAKLRAAAGFTGRRDASGMNLTAYMLLHQKVEVAQQCWHRCLTVATLFQTSELSIKLWRKSKQAPT